MFGDGRERIDQSVLFLQSDHTAVRDNRDIEALVDEKGELPVASFEGHNATKRKETPLPWSKPRLGWAKQNSDASFHEEESEGAWGAVLRDEHGGVILSAWGFIPSCPTAECAEAIAGYESVKCIIPRYAGPVHLENDCASLVSELKEEVVSKSAITGIVQDTKLALGSFPECDRYESKPCKQHGSS